MKERHVQRTKMDDPGAKWLSACGEKTLKSHPEQRCRKKQMKKSVRHQQGEVRTRSAPRQARVTAGAGLVRPPRRRLGQAGRPFIFAPAGILSAPRSGLLYFGCPASAQPAWR
mgnify:CR=1 FL=1